MAVFHTDQASLFGVKWICSFLIYNNMSSLSFSLRTSLAYSIFLFLSDTIYVRVYETRMDLLRALIVGPAGTPYHDGLFVFDVLFPPTYPDIPPVCARVNKVTLPVIMKFPIVIN